MQKRSALRVPEASAILGPCVGGGHPISGHFSAAHSRSVCAKPFCIDECIRSSLAAVMSEFLKDVLNVLLCRSGLGCTSCGVAQCSGCRPCRLEQAPGSRPRVPAIFPGPCESRQVYPAVCSSSTAAIDRQHQRSQPAGLGKHLAETLATSC